MQELHMKLELFKLSAFLLAPLVLALEGSCFRVSEVVLFHIFSDRKGLWTEDTFEGFDLCMELDVSSLTIQACEHLLTKGAR
eukprot:CAMPEP_0170559540 /NCGR_PEP_ID=MMETSP0211-20121228/43435_1 /TAXON_ID=311385 /ORGANISM="Pseudokeronopsis sp., Strain OXSARD2" /LENGTH=81 /DNA_ID=CAMNT_0010872667 /DNA_START=447 /DNA_END=689 /DNA_ORIENTATION=-